jgi:acyl-CoA dehydrogenase family protein 9
MLTRGTSNGKASAGEPYADVTSGKYFLQLAFRRIRERFAALDDNDDAGLLASARSMIGKF